MRLFENILSQTNSIYKENERKRLLFSIKSYILCQTRIIRTEAYRSGHNEAVLKTVWVHAHGGSNPSASARRKKYEPLRFVFLSFYVCQGIRTGWQAARKKGLILYGKTSRPNNRRNGCLQPRRDSECTETQMSEN